jgi:GNAT superfamily N-acetyltransferase
MQIMTEQKGDFIITTDKSKLDLKVIHSFLAYESYWSQNIPFEIVKAASENSLNFGLFYKNQQVGYARVVTDYATTAYLGDVFVLKEFRGLGLSKWLMQIIMNHPDLQGLRRWILATKDAHGLYKQFGWKMMAAPERWMEKHNPDVYTMV